MPSAGVTPPPATRVIVAAGGGRPSAAPSALTRLSGGGPADSDRGVAKSPARDYNEESMRSTVTRRQHGLRFLASGFVGALLLAAFSAGAGAGGLQGAGVVPCPLTAAELSAILGKTVQRVNLTSSNGDPAAKCEFSAVAKSSSNRFLSPQVYLTVDSGGAADLRDLYLYYLGARAKLAGRPRVALRPDLGAGAFTLTTTAGPVATAYFPVGKSSIGTLSVDLVDAAAAKRDQETVDRILTLVRNRLR